MSLRELTEINPQSSTLKYWIDRLWQEVARLANALSGKLDEIFGWTTARPGECALVGNHGGGGDIRRSHGRQ